jgi:hypothetical protein
MTMTTGRSVMGRSSGAKPEKVIRASTGAARMTLSKS